MIANFGGYYIHPSKAVKFGVLKSHRGTISQRATRVNLRMNLRVFAMLSACFFCGAALIARSQTAASTPPRTSDEHYIPFKKCWEYSVANIGRASVSSINGTVYVAETEGRVRALNLRTATVKWVSDLGGRVTALHAVPEVGIAAVSTVASGGKRSTVRLLSADSGLVKYSVGVDVGENVYLISDGSLLVVFDPDGSVIALNVQDGMVKWHSKLPAKITAPPANFDGNVFIATDDKKLRILSAATGAPAASISTERVVTALGIRENGMIVAGDDRGLVTNYRDLSGTLWWKFKSGARIGTVSETAEGILIGSFDNFLYMVSKYTGDVKWKRRLDGRIVSTPAVLANRIITASSTEPNAQIIDLETGKSVDQIAFGEERFMLTRPYVGENNVMVFVLVDGIAAYAPDGCPGK